MKQALLVISIGVVAGMGYFSYLQRQKAPVVPVSISPKEKPLLKYTYDNLRSYKPTAQGFRLGKETRKGATSSSYIFYFITEGKEVSGLMNIPQETGSYLVVVLIRGYVDPAVYTSGMGTQHVGEYFADHKYITISPDFLGYGESDMPPGDVFEDRFRTYTTVIDLLASVPQIQKALTARGLTQQTVNSSKIRIWAHSNGGQITLSVAEITGFT